MSFIISICTILASGVFAAIVTYLLNTTKEHVFFMRRKAEELYLAFEQYNRGVSGMFNVYWRVFENEMTYDQHVDFLSKNFPNATDIGNNLNMAEMLTRMYFPEFGAHFDRYETARNRMRDIVNSYKRAYEQGDIDGKRWFDPFHESVLEFDKTGTAFKRAIIDKGRELAPADTLWPHSLSWKTLRDLRDRLSHFIDRR